ncbi:MAG: EAL domain-containing protein [Woeseiaceae bacterium]|nr:EAL domain-containing protein [Woeseiaceae bacterium]
MTNMSKWLLPGMLGLILLVITLAALRASDQHRNAEIERDAHAVAVRIVTSIQRQLIQIEDALRVYNWPTSANADRPATGPLSRDDAILWRQTGAQLDAVPSSAVNDPALVLQVSDASGIALTAPITSSTGRDLVHQSVESDGRIISISYPADTLIAKIASDSLMLDSLALVWAAVESGNANADIFRVSRSVETTPHFIGFPVPGGQWQLHYNSSISLRQAELNWSLYVSAAVLAYLLALTIHRLQRQPEVLRGDLQRLNQRFRKLNDEMAVMVRSREKVQDRIHQLSVTDTETGLPNRQALMSRLDELLSQRRETADDKPASIVVLGLRDVENAEHTLGHSVVSSVLPEIARRLSEYLHEGDFVARTNNYQLAVLLSQSDNEAALDHVKKWSKSIITGVYEHKLGNINVSPLFGIASSDDGYSVAERLMENAMSALSDADALTARWSVFAADSRDDRATRIQLESDFKSAVENNEFRLYFQPIVHTDTGKPRGFECLVRWQHPVEGLLPPGRFIELGESTGLITELTRWELREAVRQAQSWDNLHRLGCYLSINLSPLDLLYPHLVEEFSTIVREARLSPSTFRLEITESMVINNVSQTRKMLNELRDEGFGIMMDDFGTGFSSLSYLRQLPFSAVKIDRSFTQAITWDTKDFGLVRNIINLVHFLEMETIIEGVETEEQHDMLKALEPVYLQGYLFAKPMTAIDAEDFLVNHIELAKRDSIPV